MTKYYVIKNPETGKYIQIDQSSGGYPYETELKDAKFWTVKCQALDYKASFYSENNTYKANNWEIRELELVVS